MLGRSPSREAGIVISIMMDDAEVAVATITGAGWEDPPPLNPDDSGITAWFSYSGGNLMGTNQQPTG